MARLPGTKNKTRVEVTLTPWYGDKLKELRVDADFDSDEQFAGWLLRSTIQILCGQREPSNAKRDDLRLRMQQALPSPEVINE
jgi:hypothetical protein